MTITQRFNSLLFGAFICLVCLTGLFIFEMGRVYDAVNFSNANIVPSVLTLDDATRNFGRLRVRLYRHLLSSEPGNRRDVENSIGEARAELQKNLKDYTPCWRMKKTGVCWRPKFRRWPNTRPISPASWRPPTVTGTRRPWR